MKKWGLVVAVVAVVGIAASVHAEIGVGIDWFESSLVPNMVLPIKLEGGMVLEPVLGFTRLDPKGWGTNAGTEIRAGLRFEKMMLADGTTPLFGAHAMVSLVSPDAPEGMEADDSYTDFAIGVFLGGSASLGNNLDIVGRWGPNIVLYGKRSDNGESWTDFGSSASITFRYWLWGLK